VGSKEYHFLACLHESLDRFVSDADLKFEILDRCGSRDATRRRRQGAVPADEYATMWRHPFPVATVERLGTDLRGRIAPGPA
jgi:hypothetical protein